MRLNGMRSKISIALLAVVLVLGTATFLYASSGYDPLSPAKLKDLGWRVMNFVALMIILIKFVKKPLANALSARKQGIADQFEGLNERRAEVQANYQKCEEKLSQIDSEVTRIIDNAKAQGETEKARIIEDANRSATDIKRKAELSIQFEISESRMRLQAEIADQATQMAEALIRRNLQEADQNKIVEDYLDKVGALQ